MTNPHAKVHIVETNNPTREQEDLALEKTGLLKITFASVILKGILLSLLLSITHCVVTVIKSTFNIMSLHEHSPHRLLPLGSPKETCFS